MNHLTISPDRLSRLRELCLSLPEAVEKETWGDPTWRVRDRIFAMQKGNYEGGRPSLWCKAPDGAQEALVGSGAGRIFVPPYVGHKGWVGVYLDGGGRMGGAGRPDRAELPADRPEAAGGAPRRLKAQPY